MTNRVGEPFEYPHSDDDGYIVDQRRVKGGSKVVPNIAGRNAIPAASRVLGMEVKVVDYDGNGNSRTYELKGGLTNTDWSVVTTGSGGSGGGQQGGGSASNFRDLQDFARTPHQYTGLNAGRKILTRIKAGKTVGTDADAIEYVSVPDPDVFVKLDKHFIENKGYGGARTDFSRPEKGLAIKPTSSTPAEIFLNQEGIGNPASSSNSLSTNTHVFADTYFLFRAKRAAVTGGNTPNPIHQKYRFTFIGANSAGQAVSQQVDFDLYSLPQTVGTFAEYHFEIPRGIASLFKVQIGKVPSDAVSTASTGLIIQTITLTSNTQGTGTLSIKEVDGLRKVLKRPVPSFEVKEIIKSDRDSNITITGGANDLFFALSDAFDKFAGMPESTKTAAGSAGIFRADTDNNRWELVTKGSELVNGIIAELQTNELWNYRSKDLFNKLSPRFLQDLENMNRSSIEEPDTFDTLTYLQKGDTVQAGGHWVAKYNPLSGYFRTASTYTISKDVNSKIVVTQGTQPGAGSPGRDSARSSYIMDVRKDTRIRTYFNRAKTDNRIFNGGGFSLVFYAFTLTAGTPFRYNLVLHGKDTQGRPESFSTSVQGIASNKPTWFTSDQELPVSMQEVTYIEWRPEDDDLSSKLHLQVVGVVNPRIALDLPGYHPEDPGEF